MTRLRIGRTRSGDDLWYSPFDARHVALTGGTRTGKSTLLYLMLSQLAGLPVAVAGIDPSGIVFNAIGGALGGTRFRASTLRDVDRVRDVTDDLVHEMDDRIERLLALWKDAFGERDFTPEFPLLVVVLEEWPGTLAALSAWDTASGARAGDRIEPRVRANIQRLVLEGAKVGIRVWCVAQRADAAILSGVFRSQLTVRFSFRQDGDGLRMMHEGITPEQVLAVQRFAPGQGLAEYLGDMPLTPFRADFITYGELVNRFRGAREAR